MFNKILVPLDGSFLAESALRPALALAQQTGAALLFLRVPVYPELPPAVAAVYDLVRSSDSQALIRDQVERYLKSMRQAILGLSVSLEIRVVDGEAAGVIVDTAATEGVDLIVMSTHGRTGLKRWWLGSVTEKVVRGASCPVLVVRSERLPERILVPLDGSKLAERALAPALALAHSFSCELSLVRILEPMDPEALADYLIEDAGPEARERLQTALQQEAEAYLQTVAERYRQQDRPPATAVMAGPVAPTILAYAEEARVDLIAMSSHGQSAQARWAYGSVTEKVVHGAGCAVLVVPQPWRRDRQKDMR